MSFNSIPVLDLTLSRDPQTKPVFLEDLRNALLEVGFLYISNTGIDAALIDDVIAQGKLFFDLPEEKKLEVQMKNAPSFLGYNVLGNEITRYSIDWREQIDISTEHQPPSPDAPRYHNLLSPNQWPDPSYLPSFRSVYETYIRQMSRLSISFTSLIAEALDLPSTAFDRFFDADQQHKLKIVKYPDRDELRGGGGLSSSLSQDDVEEESQGVGPHKDSMLTSYLLQASHHRGLQAQNMAGKWIDCPPVPGTLVVAIGQGLEAITHGVCASTTHRVLSPGRGQGARFSVPFFQGVSYDATFETSVDVPERIRRMRRDVLERNEGRKKDDVEFTFKKGGGFEHLGEATLFNRCKSHMDVAERWYPDIWAEIMKLQKKKQKEEKRGEEDEDKDKEESEGEDGDGRRRKRKGVDQGVERRADTTTPPPSTKANPIKAH